MSQRIETERDEANRFPHAADELSASSQPPHPASQIIPFPQSRSAAISASAAGGEPPSPPASFISLGTATAAVLMRLSTQFPRFKAIVPTREEDGRDDLGARWEEE